jgi:hypothetical protein
MVLLHVVEVPGGATSATFGLLKEEARGALGEPEKRVSAEIRDRLKEAGIDFEIEIAFGPPAKSWSSPGRTTSNTSSSGTTAVPASRGCCWAVSPRRSSAVRRCR